MGVSMGRSRLVEEQVVRDHDVVCGLVGGVLGDPVCRFKGDIVRKGVAGDGDGDGKRTVALFAGHGKVVGEVGFGVETNAFGGVCLSLRGLEAPEGASTFPGCTDEGVVNVDALDAACAPCVCWQRVSARGTLEDDEWHRFRK